MARRHPSTNEIPHDGVERKCWACYSTDMRPDEPVHRGDKYNPQPGELWFFKCAKCGARLQWIYGPVMDGSYAQKHKLPGGGFCSTSMMSDPDCSVFPRHPKFKTTDNPTGIEPGTPLFVYDEHGNKTHRWHWGRKEWVKREVER